MTIIPRRALQYVLPVLCLLVSVELRSQSCPTTSPNVSGNVQVICSGGGAQPCLLNQSVTLTPPAAYTVQSCDSLQWTFNDGSPTVIVTGTGPITHTYTKTGVFSASLFISNSKGSAFYSASVSVSSTPGCPTQFPVTPGLTWSSPSCASNFSLPCALNEPLSFTVSPYFSGSGTLQACDRATISFGDGATATLPAGTFTTTHSYAAAGVYNLGVTLENDFGRNSGFGNSLTAANGTIAFLNSFQPNVTEGGVFHVDVTRSQSAGSVSVSYRTADNTARAGVHYVATSGTLTFAPGETRKTIDVPTINDASYNGQLSFNLVLSSPTNDYVLGSPNITSLSITDDDIPTIAFTQTSFSAREDAGSLVVNLTRTGDPSKIVSVNYSVNPTTCCSQVPGLSGSGVVNFLGGETSKAITLFIANDNVYEGTRTYSLSLYAGGANVASPSSATITLTDDDPLPTITVDSIAVVEGNAGNSTANVTLHLSQSLPSSLSFNWQTVDGTATAGSDYVRVFSFTSGNFPAGATTTSVAVTIIGDTRVEADETFNVNVINPFATSMVSTGVVTILNDDIGISPAAQTIPKGTSSSVTISGLPAFATPQTIAVQALDANVATAQDVVVTPGSRSVSIEVNAVGAGSTQIVATLPTSLGGITLSALVTVFEGTAIVLDPRNVSAPLGATANVHVSLQPAVGTPVTIAITANAKFVDVPATITVPAGGSTTLSIKTLKIGGTSITATLPASNGGTPFALFVDVTDPAATLGISSISPSTGSTAGGTAVTITGTRLQADCQLLFGDAAGTVASSDATTLVAATPAHSAGTVDVVVTCGTASSVLANGFTFVSTAPVIMQVAPSFGSAAGGTLVRLTGTNIAPACWPFFDDVPARGAIVRNGAEIVAAAPAHAAGTVTVSVRCDSNAASSSLTRSFTYVAAPEQSPVLTSIAPLAGSPGQAVVIGGAWFNRGDNVTFDDVAAGILSAAPDALTVRIPDVPVSRASVTVTDAASHSSTSGPIFTILEPQTPQISGVAPRSIAPGAELTIDGSGFRPAVYTFAFGEVAAPAVTTTYNRAIVRVPEGLAAGVVTLNILNAAGHIAVIGPSITITRTGIAAASATTQCVTTEGGTTLVIHGSDFNAGARVSIDGVNASAVVKNAQTISVTLPPLPPGSPAITVTNPNGERATLTNAVRVFSPFDPEAACSGRLRAVRH